jgi:PAS domain-containing protein
MVTIDEFSRLVSGIYAAAITPQYWEVAIREIHRTLGGSGGGLLMADGAVMAHRASTLPMEAANRYAEYYHRLDRVLAAVERGPVGAARTGSELMPLVRKSEFYRDWLRPLDIDDGLFIRLTDGPSPPCFIVAAPKRTESFDSPERLKLVNGLIPHLQQALRTQGKLAALDRSSADLAGAVEAVRHGMVIVGSDSWVINLNTAAERILGAEDGLQMRSAHVVATSAQADNALRCTRRSAAAPPRSAAVDRFSASARRVNGPMLFMCCRCITQQPTRHQTKQGHWC